MKDSKFFSINNKKIKNDISNLKQIPTRFKTNLISLKSLPTSQAVPGSKSFRQQARCFTTKNSKEKPKNSKIIESVSFELNSRGKEHQKLKNKNLIMNSKNFLNYTNSKVNSNYLNYTNPSTNNNNFNIGGNNNNNKSNLFYIQKIDEEPQQLRINTVINTRGQTFSVSANNSISNKNKKKLNNHKFISCLTGWSIGYKGAIKGYNTTNNTANNSVTGSMEKLDKKKHNKKYKKNSNKKYRKNFINSKEVIQKINNNIEFNLLQKQNNKKFKNKFAHTTNNSRQNSGEKYLEITKPKLLALKHNKLILNNIRELNSNNNCNNNYIKNKQESTQTTIDNKQNKNFTQKNNNNINSKNDKGISKTNNNCQTKNHIIRKNNQETMKISHTNANVNSNINGKGGKIKVMNVKLNDANINMNINNNYLKTNLYSNINTKSNSAFSTRQNLKVEISQIKVNKSNKMINNNNTNGNNNNEVNNNNINKGMIFKPKYKNKNLKNIDVFNVNEESLEIIKNENQNNLPTAYFFNKIDEELNKKILTAGNSPGRVKINKLISEDVCFQKQKIGEKIITFQNIKPIMGKDSNNDFGKKKNNNISLKSAHISRKNSANKEFKDYKNIKSENKIISNKNKKNNFKYDNYYYNYSHPNNSLKSNSSEKDLYNNSFIESNFNSNFNSNNASKNTNTKNSTKVFNSIINVCNNWKYKKNKQLTKNINILDNINGINKGIQIKYNSSNTSKYKLSNKSTNINITNFTISKTKCNHHYDKKKVDITDNNSNNCQTNEN